MLRANAILFNKRGNAACCRDRRQATVSGRRTLPRGGGVLIAGRSPSPCGLGPTAGGEGQGRGRGAASGDKRSP